MTFISLLRNFAHAGFLGTSSRRQPSPAAPSSPELRTLQRHATLPLANVHLQLRVLRGCVWITRDGDPADVVLEADSIYEQRPGARVLVHALATADIRIAGVSAAA